MPFPLAPHRLLLVVAGVCAAGVLSACDVTIKDGDVSFNQLHGRAAREFKRTYPLTAGGKVEIVNVNGPIVVSTGEAGSVQVTAAMTARAMTDDRAKEVLDAAKIEESAAPDHVRVATARGNRRGGLRVAYTVTVPADSRVELTTTNGDLQGKNLRGHLKAMMMNGEIELDGIEGTVDAAAVNGRMTVKMSAVTGAIRLDGTNGRVNLELPKDARATLTARSVNGGIAVRGLTAHEDSPGRRIQNIESQLNGGGPPIDIRVTNGRITIEGK